MRKIQVKRGSTFTWTGTYLRNGVAQPVEALTITSQIRGIDGTLLADLVIEKLLGQTGKYTLYGNAAGWAVGTYYCDIKYAEAGQVAYTDSFIVVVEPSQTA